MMSPPSSQSVATSVPDHGSVSRIAGAHRLRQGAFAVQESCAAVIVGAVDEIQVGSKKRTGFGRRVVDGLSARHVRNSFLLLDSHCHGGLLWTQLSLWAEGVSRRTPQNM